MSVLGTEQVKAVPLKPQGLYIHVPFCSSTCDFCAFYQVKPQRDDIDRYLRTIEAEAGLIAWPRPIKTIFWGGGTPGLLAPTDLHRLGEIVLRHSGGQPEEWTVELAPASVTPERLRVLRSLGVTRISMGAQSFQSSLLEALGRQHTREQILRAYTLIRSMDFPSVNIDLMFALPGQTESEWHADLGEAVALAPDHLSTYCLTFEEDTKLWVKLSKGQVKRDTRNEAKLYEETWDFLGEAGFEQYEVANFAKPGHRCLHNLNTWRMNDWVGLGPSGASQHDGWRGSNPADLARWCDLVQSGRRMSEDRLAMTLAQYAEDALIFGLRMNEGVSLPHWKALAPNVDWPRVEVTCQGLETEGLARFSKDGTLALTRRGRLLADSVALEVMDAFEADKLASAE